ncbi:hypothetical protein BJ956_002632 [Arthrobacter psychrochitiniphilus]|nr:hypothetical protein [Arthrobacter psychrochitiniphilus]
MLSSTLATVGTGPSVDGQSIAIKDGRRHFDYR